MSFIAGDLSILEEYVEITNASEFTGASKSYTSGNLYIIVIGSQDTTSNEYPTNIATNAGITWTQMDNRQSTDEMHIAYYGVASSNFSDTTVVTFDSSQEACTWYILEITNAKASGPIVQSQDGGGIGNSISVTLPEAVTAGNLVIGSFWCDTSRSWTVGTGQTALSGTASRRGFVSYNLSEASTCAATINSTQVKLGIVIEVAYNDVATVSVNNVNGGSTIGNGDTDISVTGINFSGTSDFVTLSSVDNISDASAVAQSTTSVSTIEATIDTVVLPTGHDPDDPVYVFVHNGTSANANGFQASVTPPVTPTLMTVYFTDDGTDTGNAIVCTSTDFTTGMSFSVYRAATPTTEEVATAVEAISVSDTSAPQFNVTFPNGDPSGSDVIKVSYDGTGDIKGATGTGADDISLQTATDFTGETC